MGVIISNRAIDWGFFPIGLAIALAAGYGNGFWMWNRYENKYRELFGRR
jgi:nitrate reductase NapE component